MTPPTDTVTPISDEDLAATFKRLSLPRAWPDDELAFRQEVRQRLGHLEQLLEVLARRHSQELCQHMERLEWQIGALALQVHDPGGGENGSLASSAERGSS